MGALPAASPCWVQGHTVQRTWPTIHISSPCIEQLVFHLLIATFHAKSAQRGTGIWHAHMPVCPLGHFGILEAVRGCTHIRRNMPKKAALREKCASKVASVTDKQGSKESTSSQIPSASHISFFPSCHKKFRMSTISFSMYRKQSKVIWHTKKQENITHTLEKI